MRRTTLISLSVFAAAIATAAACSDQEQKSPTAPTAGGVTPPAASQSSVSAPIATAAKGAGGSTKVTRVTSGWVDVAPNASATAVVTCPEGTVVTGGGHGFGVIGAASAPAFVRNSAAEPNQNGWTVTVMNYATGATSATFSAIAFCAS